MKLDERLIKPFKTNIAHIPQKKMQNTCSFLMAQGSKHVDAQNKKIYKIFAYGSRERTC